jgi:ferredoxin
MKINKSLCDICGTCVSVCPTDAIEVFEFEIKIDDEKCVHCGNCVKVCPISALKDE